MTVQNITSLRRKLRMLPDHLKQPIIKGFDTAAGEIMAEMLDRVPKAEGVIAANISRKASADKLSWKIGLRGKRANRRAFYAKFIEFGTRKMAAQPFALPALESVAPRIVRDIAILANRALRRARNL